MSSQEFLYYWADSISKSVNKSICSYTYSEATMFLYNIEQGYAASRVQIPTLPFTTSDLAT